MKLILIDGYGFVFRAFHSLPPLTRGSDKKPIGAVYGFVNMLLKLLKAHDFDHLAVVLDSGDKNFRHDLYPLYKANRPTPPEALIVQFPMIREAAEAFGIQVLEKSGCEADDLIATYAKAASSAGYDVTIISSDKDLLQLAGERIEIYDAVKERVLDDTYTQTKFGISCEQIGDFLALLGDSSDNIPGVKGIGLKAAQELISKYNTLDNIYAHIDEIEPTRRKNLLLEGKENAYLSRRLITLNEDVEMIASLESLQFHDIDKPRLANYLSQQGFKSLAAKFEIAADSGRNYIQITSAKELAALITKKPQTLSFWLHDTHLYVTFHETFLKCSIAAKTQGNLFDDSTQLLGDYLDTLKPMLIDCDVLKLTIKLKEFLKMGYVINNVHDLEIMAYSLLTKRNGYTYDGLSAQYGHDLESIYTQLQTKLYTHHVATLYHRMDRFLPHIVHEIEERGVAIDLDCLNQLSAEFTSKLKEIEANIFKQAGCEFNIASPKQLKDVLNSAFNLKIDSTSIEVLEDLENKGIGIANDIMTYRHFHKLLTTYTEALPKSINTSSGRVHTTFNITATATARFSSTNPNLQNIPIRSAEGNKIRAAIAARTGYSIISADYSQIELRLLAHLANIPSLIEAFHHNRDIHEATARDMFGVAQVDADLRRKAKTINFGIIYGISAFGLSKRLDITPAQAQSFIDKYFKQYPGIKQYMDAMIDYARMHGYVTSIFGRRCEILDINASNYNVRTFSERVAINAPLQSSSADIIRKAMCDLPADLRKYLILQVHDELLFEVPDSEIQSASKAITKVMDSVCTLKVPLIASVSSGKNWMECK